MGRTKESSGGKREDLGIYVRSKWEANYARVLNLLQKHGEVESWEYEAEVFRFPGITRGTTEYRPDFKVILGNGLIEYHEVKGWMDQRSKVQMKRMAKYFPHVNIVVIGKDEYYTIQRQCRALIKEWE